MSETEPEMSLTPQHVSAELATDVLVDYIREHCRKETVGEYGKAARFRTSFFSPSKKLRLFEEVFFLHASLALDAVAKTETDRATKVYMRTLLQYKVQKKIGELVGQGDPSFGTRRATHMKSYATHLAGGGDEIGLAAAFLEQLHLTSAKSLDLQASMELLPRLVAARRFVGQVAASLIVQPNSEAEDSDI